MSIFNMFNRSVEAGLTNTVLTPMQRYEKLEAYYRQNDLYSGPSLNSFWADKWMEAMKPLRSSVHRSVEFYCAKLLPGEMSIVTDKEALKSAIEQIMTWSNFEQIKQRALRGYSLKGDLFWKINSAPDKIYAEIIEPEKVVDFTEDSRGYLQTIRIEFPIVTEDEQDAYYIEFWDKGNNYWATWENSQFGLPLEQLDPSTAKSYGMISELGVNFLPFVHVKFSDVGENRGDGCANHALDKIDEANRQTTRLHQMLFRYGKPLWVKSANAVGPNGEPLPAPRITTKKGSKDNTDASELEDDSIMSMPGMSKLESLVPNINYDAALNIVNAMMEEIEQDMPELRYFSLKPSANLSGKAISMLLAGALDKASEARSNFLSGLVRVCQIGITMGEYSGVIQKSVGDYNNGDLDFSFKINDVFQADDTEKATDLQTLVGAGIPLLDAMKIAGYSTEQIDEVEQDMPKQPPSQPTGTATGLQLAPGDITAALNAAKAKGLGKAANLMMKGKG